MSRDVFLEKPVPKKSSPYLFPNTDRLLMNTHSSPPPVTWNLSGEPCDTLEKALSAVKNNKEAFIICDRGDDFLQALYEELDSYFCEISFANGQCRELYAAPKPLTYAQLYDLFSRYAAGEDLSYLKREWTLQEEQSNRWPPIIISAVIFIIIVLILFSRS